MRRGCWVVGKWYEWYILEGEGKEAWGLRRLVGGGGSVSGSCGYTVSWTKSMRFEMLWM